MPWKVSDPMSLREEFVAFAMQPEVKIAPLCRRFNISRASAYKWIKRAREGASMADQSRRPKRSPNRTDELMEQAVIQVRQAHDAWGPRKIARVLKERGMTDVPSPSTITSILHRHNLIDADGPLTQGPWQRFEHAHPNDLWQMDFKGHFGLADGKRSHPLTVLDDHSRYSLVVQSCADEKTQTVKTTLIEVFRTYGLPRRILTDNGSPWGGVSTHGLTPLTVWLAHLDVAMSHGRPSHPQTQGKEERFHRTLKAEALRDQRFADHAASQAAFDRFRHCYNHERPHEALGLEVPASRYRPSVRSYPEALPVFEYASGVSVRKVQQGGVLHYKGRTCRLPDALVGELVGLEPTLEDGVLSVWLGRQQIGVIDEREKALLFACRSSARCARSAAAGESVACNV